MGNFLGVVGLGGFLLVLLYQTSFDAAHPTAADKPGCRGKSDPDLARAIAQKWAPVFGTTVDIMMRIAKVESDFRPDCANYSVRGLTRGGAMGMWQMTFKTGRGHARDLASNTNVQVQATMKKWDDTRACLKDPDLCGMMAAKQLGELSRMFKGDLAAIAGGYQQGALAPRIVLAAGGRLPDDLPKTGRDYATKVLGMKAMG